MHTTSYPLRLLNDANAALAVAERLHRRTKLAVQSMVSLRDSVRFELLEKHQYATHGFAWQATTVEALRQALNWASSLNGVGQFGEVEQAIIRLGFAEYSAQLCGGIPMSQTEIVRPSDMGVDPDDFADLRKDAAVFSSVNGSDRSMLAIAAAEGRFGALGLEDPALEATRLEILRFAAAEITPHAQRWHDENLLLPAKLVGKLSELGVFGLTIPEEYGGLGLGKVTMCLVSEALSGGYLGAGSLGTRSEIAAELIRLGGTREQKERWLPGIASGAVLPAAVFTEPDTGSDLGGLRTRAVRHGDSYRIHGAKTWITHGSRSDLMTLLVRTDAGSRGYEGLSMLLAEKPRGTEENPFPADGMSGNEISVLGYRGMKEFEIAFDGFVVPAENLLGSVEGQGFKQLMETFESARIQTAARALGVAQNALELGLSYASDRNQFGKAIISFPRVHAKLAWMTVETMLARQLTYHAARQKDAGRRCDIDAGMAKLLAARVAFANADCALQIHGGNGYALEYPISRVLCDARILSIFEGSAEIQAQVVARGLLGRAD